MPDCTIWDIAEGVKTTWSNQSALTTLIPANSLYLQRAPEGSTLPYCVFSFEDISAFFGGTEYFSGREYVKQTRVTFTTYGTRAFGFQEFGQAISNAFGWSDGNPSGQWTIPNATMISTMPETESIGISEEKVNGEDVVKYTSSFSLKMQVDRG